MKVSDILRKCHKGIDKDISKKKELKKRRYEEFLKFISDSAATD